MRLSACDVKKVKREKKRITSQVPISPLVVTWALYVCVLPMVMTSLPGFIRRCPIRFLRAPHWADGEVGLIWSLRTECAIKKDKNRTGFPTVTYTPVRECGSIMVG